MSPDANSAFKWTHVRRLYRDWGTLKTCLRAFTLIVVIAFVFMTVLCGFSDGFSLDSLAFQVKMFGVILLVVWTITMPSYYIWAWANGGVDEWEYEMDDYGIEGRKVVRKAWRMKLLRGFAWILMLLPTRANQKMAMRSLLYDNWKKKVDVSFSSVKGVSCDEKKERISLETKCDVKEIHVPRDGYAEVRAFIEERIPKKKPKNRKTGGRTGSSTTESKEKEVTA